MSSTILTTVIVYISEGLSILSLNVILAVAILLSNPLRQRKELVFIIGLSISDAIYGVGCAEYGRDMLFNSYLSNRSSLPITPWQCFLKPREWVLTYAFQVSMVIMCLISGERLLAVVSIQGYAKMTYRNHVYMLVFAYLLPLFTFIAAGIETHTKTLAGFVMANDCRSYSHIYSEILPVIMLTLGLSNVVLYTAVFVAYNVKVSPAARQANARPSSSLQTARTRRLTQTLALITGCMLLFYCVPLIAARIMMSYYIYSFLLYIYMFMPLQYIAHVLVFVWRQKEIREGMKDLICCNLRKKTITANISVPQNGGGPMRRNTVPSSPLIRY